MTHVDRFAAADVFVRTPGNAPEGASARLFAVDPVLYQAPPLGARVVSGSLGGGALLGQTLRDYSTAFANDDTGHDRPARAAGAGR